MPTSYAQLFLAAYAAIGICVAVVYTIIDQVRARRGSRRPIVARTSRGRRNRTRLYSRLTFFIKLVVMWPWIIYTLLRPK